MEDAPYPCNRFSMAVCVVLAFAIRKYDILDAVLELELELEVDDDWEETELDVVIEDKAEETEV